MLDRSDRWPDRLFSQQHTRVADDLDVVADVAGRSRHVVDT